LPMSSRHICTTTSPRLGQVVSSAVSTATMGRG
jgi:hypothetical protein